MEATTDAATATHTGRQGRDRLLDPVNLVLVPTLAVLLIAQHNGMIAPVPAWQICGALLLAHLPATFLAARFPPGTPRAKPRVFLATTTALTGVFLYTTGWGAVLAVTFVASAAVVIEEDGARYGPTAIVLTLVTILVGEIAVSLGIFQTMVSEPTGHGIAVIEAVVTVTVIALLARGQREKELAERERREGEERFRALVQYASDAILVIADGGDVKYASPAVAQLLGCPPEELLRFDTGWIDADHADAVVELFRELKTRPGGVEVAELPVRGPDGTSKWVEVHLTNLIETSAVGGYVCNMRDIGARRTAHQQLMHDAQHDPLTKLANRRLFLERLDRAWHDAPTATDAFAVLFIDVDHFKEINDELGHEVGDEVLVTIADTLTGMLRPTDLVARFGGDEFTVLLDPVADLEDALEIAERIRAQVSGPRRIAGRDVCLEVSVGVATSSSADSAGDVLRHSDEAMYCAKHGGRARCAGFADAEAPISATPATP